MKRYLTAAALVALGFAIPGARANTALFTFPSSSTATAGSTLGTSASYTSAGLTLNIFSEECTSASGATPCSGAWYSSAPNLYVGSSGLGVVDSAAGGKNELAYVNGGGTSTYYFVQVDFSQASGYASWNQMVFNFAGLGGSSGSPSYEIYGITSAGTSSIGTLLSSGTTTGTTATVSVPISKGSTVFTGYNVVIDCSAVEYGAISSITTASPEPATCVLMGIALLGLGLGGRKLRRRG